MRGLVGVNVHKQTQLETEITAEPLLIITQSSCPAADSLAEAQIAHEVVQ